MRGFEARDVPDQTGKTFVVTGANTGLGLEIARVIAARRGRVFLACRSEDKARGAMDSIRADVPGADLEFVALDQADLDSVRACAKALEGEERIDVLVNNAGVMFPPLERTAQGHELQFGVNHLAVFALSGLLLPKLAQTQGARIVATASLAHWRGDVQWDDLDSLGHYDKSRRYCDSKLMNLLFIAELDRRLRAAGSPVSAYACHPGVAATDLVRHMPKIAQSAWPLICKVLNSAEQGAWPALQAATDPAAAPGTYFGPRGFRGARGDSGPNPRSKAAKDPIAAKRLWDISTEMTGVDYGLPAA